MNVDEILESGVISLERPHGLPIHKGSIVMLKHNRTFVDWEMPAKVIAVVREIVYVKPDEPITSPANWSIKGIKV